MPTHSILTPEVLALAATVLLVLLVLHLTFTGFRMVGITPLEVTLLLFVSPFLAPVNVPIWSEPGVVYGANLAGVGVPAYLSLRFLRSRRLPVWKGVLGTAVVSYLAYRWAQVDPSQGVLVPALPLVVVAAVVGALVAGRSWRQVGPATYVSGALGTLVGADLVNLGAFVDPSRGETLFMVVGGAGTLDAIFLISLYAVVATILAALLARVLGGGPG
jgi:uncharacterized membrane protein